MSNVAIFVSLNTDRWNAPLYHFFTGCYAYHTGFVDLESGFMYDMNLLRRRRIWMEYASRRNVEVYASPVAISREYLEAQLDSDTNRYGYWDYALFALRPLYHLFGKVTRNQKGVICSEMVNADLRAHGCKTPWPLEDGPPSPCDIRQWLRLREAYGGPRL